MYVRSKSVKVHCKILSLSPGNKDLIELYAAVSKSDLNVCSSMLVPSDSILSLIMLTTAVYVSPLFFGSKQKTIGKMLPRYSP